VPRDAYAVGRLSLEELDERSAAAYTARTRGELDDLTADLPPPPGGLPSDIVATRNTARYLAYRRCVRNITSCVPVLIAGLGGPLFPATVWIAAVDVLLVLVVPRWRGGRGGPHGH
jgi:DUF1707 SHOCT-like domain